MIRLIATDLDGTLLEKDGTLPEGFFDVARSLLKQGIAVAAASGRQYDNLRRLFYPIAGEMSFICENGGLCATGRQIVATTPVDMELVLAVARDLTSLGMRVMISGVKCCYMLDNDRVFTDDITYRLRNTVSIVPDFSMIDEPVIKFSGYTPHGVQPFAEGLQERWADKLSAVVAGRNWFDFTLANKGTGLKNLMDSLGVKREEVVAFGDQFNDESMLDIAGHPFLMKGADPRLFKPGTRWCEKVLPVMKKMLENGGELK
ncbi:MAG: HAD family phosphatase [Clostridiales bacterium]|nr:HAD family phosphatase [Clostridiales bacterium]